MGRKKIVIKPITDERLRNITFNKRKAGLLKKAAELSMLCNIQVCLAFTDVYGNLINFFSPNMEIIEDFKKLYPYKRVYTFTKDDYPNFFGMSKMKKKKSTGKDDKNPDQSQDDSSDDSSAKIEDDQQGDDDQLEQGQENESDNAKNENENALQQDSSNQKKSKQQQKQKKKAAKNLQIIIPNKNPEIEAEMQILKIINNNFQQTSILAPENKDTGQSASEKLNLDQGIKLQGDIQNPGPSVNQMQMHQQQLKLQPTQLAAGQSVMLSSQQQQSIPQQQSMQSQQQYTELMNQALGKSFSFGQKSGSSFKKYADSTQQLYDQTRKLIKPNSNENFYNQQPDALNLQAMQKGQNSNQFQTQQPYQINNSHITQQILQQQLLQQQQGLQNSSYSQLNQQHSSNQALNKLQGQQFMQSGALLQQKQLPANASQISPQQNQPQSISSIMQAKQSDLQAPGLTPQGQQTELLEQGNQPVDNYQRQDVDMQQIHSQNDKQILLQAAQQQSPTDEFIQNPGYKKQLQQLMNLPSNLNSNKQFGQGLLPTNNMSNTLYSGGGAGQQSYLELNSLGFGEKIENWNQFQQQQQNQSNAYYNIQNYTPQNVAEQAQYLAMLKNASSQQNDQTNLQKFIDSQQKGQSNLQTKNEM